MQYRAVPSDAIASLVVMGQVKLDQIDAPEYPKIKTIWRRQSEKPHKLLPGEFALDEFRALANLPWRGWEKLDGTNVRVHWDGYKVIFGGRTNKAQMPKFLLERLEELFLGEETAQQFEECFEDTPATIYGEGFGARIQKNGGLYNPEGVDFAMFDVRIGNSFLEETDVLDIATLLDVEVVHAYPERLALEDWANIAEKGIPSAWGTAQSEGVILRPPVDLLDRRGRRIVAKIKTSDFH